jgi:hypothetical protein
MLGAAAAEVQAFGVVAWAGRHASMEPRRRMLLAQGAYYVATGLAPFASRTAFEAVTGRKREWWLVQTTGALVTAVGSGLVSAAVRDRVTAEVAVIAAGCAAGLATIDVVYVLRGRIAPVYLCDAAVEIAFVPAAVAAARAAGA